MSQVRKNPKCSICHKLPRPSCNWQQGRCPHIPPMLKLTVVDNIIKFFKRKS